MKNLTISLRSVLGAALLLIASAGANALSTVTFNSVANSVDRGGVYSGLYALTIDTQSILAMCDSRNSLINPPVTWTADILTFADIQAGGVGKFNSPSTAATLAKYSQAGWLYSQIPAQGPTNYSAQADIQEAIWKIMIPGYALVGAGASAFYTSATDTTHDAFDWSTVMLVVTPNPLVQESVDVQEFLIGTDSNVIPVPGAVWLFGSALGLLGMKPAADFLNFSYSLMSKKPRPVRGFCFWRHLIPNRRPGNRLPSGDDLFVKECLVPEDLSAIRGRLLKRQAELRSRTESTNADLRHERDPLVADFADQAVQRSNDEVLAAIGDSAKGELNQISVALRRLDAGQYTKCAVCGDEIAAERLRTVPYTDRCSSCAV